MTVTKGAIEVCVSELTPNDIRFGSYSERELEAASEEIARQKAVVGDASRRVSDRASAVFATIAGLLMVAIVLALWGERWAANLVWGLCIATFATGLISHILITKKEDELAPVLRNLNFMEACVDCALFGEAIRKKTAGNGRLVRLSYPKNWKSMEDPRIEAEVYGGASGKRSSKISIPIPKDQALAKAALPCLRKRFRKDPSGPAIDCEAAEAALKKALKH